MEGGGAGNMLNMAEEDQNELISGMSVDDARALSALVDGGGRGILDFLQTKSKGKKSDSATISSSGTNGGEDVKALSLIDQLRLLDHTEEDAIEVNALAVRLLRFASWHLSDVLPRPPVSITATTNSATSDAFREALLLLKYLRQPARRPSIQDSMEVDAAHEIFTSPSLSPSTDLHTLVRESTSDAYEQYLDAEVFKRTDAVRTNRTSAVDYRSPNAFENTEFFVGHLYLYVSPKDGDDEHRKGCPQKKTTDAKIRRFLLSIGRGINPEEALQAAARNLLQRHYYQSARTE